MGMQPIFPFKVSDTIDTMLNFDSGFNGHDAVTCEQTLACENRLTGIFVFTFVKLLLQLQTNVVAL